MHYYWAELTITENGNSVTGNAARDKVNGDLGVPVTGDGTTVAASLTWQSKTVTSELLPIVIKKIAAAQNKTWQVVFKESRDVKRTTELYARYSGGSVEAQREGLNALQRCAPPYVIVGDGAAAWVDHTTLRQTTWGRDRLAPAEIIHIGFEDPWSHYNEHEMGQYPQLLGLPGYAQRPILGDDDGQESTTAPRVSTKFAADTAFERGRMAEHVFRTKSCVINVNGLPVSVPMVSLRLPMCVLVIMPKGVTALHDSVRGAILKEGILERVLDDALADPHPEDYPHYRLLLADTATNLYWWYADKIDVCSGAGKPRAVDETMISSDAYEAVRTRIWEPVESWNDGKKQRRILSGTEGLYRETDWGMGERYCIMGSGGVGVNMVERARDDGKWADWLATKTQHESFPIARNDILLKHPTALPARAMTAGELGTGRNDQSVPLLPANAQWRFGQGSDVDTVTLAEDDVTVVFKASGNKYERVVLNALLKGANIPSSVVDYDGATSAFHAGSFPYAAVPVAATQAPDLAANHYHRLIRCAGQDIREVGNAEKVTAMLELVPITAPSDGRMVGLQTSDGSVRVLGAAGTGNANMVDKENAAFKAMGVYHGTLPAQGQIMFVGFVFSSLNVATANHYFDPAYLRVAYTLLRMSTVVVPRVIPTSQGPRVVPTFATVPTGVVPVWALLEPNTNVNTMSQAELAAYLGDARLAEKIVLVRKSTQSGYVTIAELKADLLKQARKEKATAVLVDTWTTTFDDVGLLSHHDLQIGLAVPLGVAANDALLGTKIVQARAKVPPFTKEQLKTEVGKSSQATAINGWEGMFDPVSLANLSTMSATQLGVAFNNVWLAPYVVTARTTLEAALRLPLRNEIARIRAEDLALNTGGTADELKLAPTAAWDALCDTLATQYRPADLLCY